MDRSILIVVLLLTAAFGTTAARAGGFQSRELSGRALGMGSALAALPGEATTIYVNPAALSFLAGTQLSLGTTLTFPNFTFSGLTPYAQATKMKTQASYPPNACLAYTFPNGVGIGVSVTNPYAVKTDWGEDWIGNGIVTSSELRSVQVTPAASLRIGNHWSLGLGVQIVFLRMDLNRRYGVLPASGSAIPMVYMTGSADMTYGFELGLMYAPDDIWRVSLALKSRTHSSIEQGTVTYAAVQGESGTVVMPNTTFNSSVTLPDQLRAGISIHPVPALLLAGEVGLTRWSTFKNLWVRIGSPIYEQRFEQQGWKDAFALRGGIELAIDDVRLRGGAAYEQSPIPDEQLRPSMPDANTIAFTAGIGYAIEEGLVLDLGVQVLRYQKRTITNSQVLTDNPLVSGPLQAFNGIYDLSSTVVGLSVRYSWK